MFDHLFAAKLSGHFEKLKASIHLNSNHTMGLVRVPSMKYDHLLDRLLYKEIKHQSPLVVPLKVEYQRQHS